MNKSICITSREGNNHWYLNGERHREDGPAYEGADGSKQRWINDTHHREDGPAIEYANGNRYWYLNDVQMTEHEFDTHAAPRDHPIR